MYMYVNWDEFQDVELDVIRYVWCVGIRKGICDIILEIDVGDCISVSQQVCLLLIIGMVVFVIVIFYNGVGVIIRVFFDGFKVDSIFLVVFKVIDIRLFFVF